MPHETALPAIVAMDFVVAFACGFVAIKLRLPPLVAGRGPLAHSMADFYSRVARREPMNPGRTRRR